MPSRSLTTSWPDMDPVSKYLSLKTAQERIGESCKPAKEVLSVCVAASRRCSRRSAVVTKRVDDAVSASVDVRSIDVLKMLELDGRVVTVFATAGAAGLYQHARLDTGPIH